MREFSTKDGPFLLRLLYEPKEIDEICLDALRKSGFLPAEPEPIKIDIFLEKYFEVIVAYEDLGEEIMGSTVFNSKGAVTGILIARWIEGGRNSRSGPSESVLPFPTKEAMGSSTPNYSSPSRPGDLFSSHNPAPNAPRTSCAAIPTFPQSPPQRQNTMGNGGNGRPTAQSGDCSFRVPLSADSSLPSPSKPGSARYSKNPSAPQSSEESPTSST